MTILAAKETKFGCFTQSISNANQVDINNHLAICWAIWHLPSGSGRWLKLIHRTIFIEHWFGFLSQNTPKSRFGCTFSISPLIRIRHLFSQTLAFHELHKKTSHYKTSGAHIVVNNTKEIMGTLLKTLVVPNLSPITYWLINLNFPPSFWTATLNESFFSEEKAFNLVFTATYHPVITQN